MAATPLATTCTIHNNAHTLSQAPSILPTVPAITSSVLVQQNVLPLVQSEVCSNTTEKTSETRRAGLNSIEPQPQAATGTTPVTHVPQMMRSPDGFISSEHVVHVRAKTMTTPADPNANATSLLQTSKKRKAPDVAPGLARVSCSVQLVKPTKPMTRYLCFKNALKPGLNLSPPALAEFVRQAQKKCIEFEAKFTSQPELVGQAPAWFQAWQQAGTDATRETQQYEAGMALWAVQAEDLLAQKLHAAKSGTHPSELGISIGQAEQELPEIHKFLPASHTLRIPELIQISRAQLALLAQAGLQQRLGKAIGSHNIAELQQLLPQATQICDCIGDCLRVMRSMTHLQPSQSVFTLPTFIEAARSMIRHEREETVQHQNQLATFHHLMKLLQTCESMPDATPEAVATLFQCCAQCTQWFIYAQQQPDFELAECVKQIAAGMCMLQEKWHTWQKSSSASHQPSGACP